MVIIVNSDEEEASLWRAMEVIRSLRSREHATVRPDMVESEWIRTKWAKPEYL